MRLHGTSIYSPILLKENSAVPNAVQVLRVGKFKHPKYGAFEITSQTLSDMKSNFDNKIRGVDMAFDYFHDSDKEASAWVKKLELREGNTELWAEVDWTPKAARILSERELRYFSPDFSFNWVDPEKGSTHQNVLFGGGLTNRPFVKEMAAIVATENIEIELGGPGSGPQKGGGSGGKQKESAKSSSSSKPKQQVEREKAEKDYQDFHAQMRAKYGANEDEKKYGLGDRLDKVMTPSEKATAQKVRSERLRTANFANRNEQGPAERANQNISGVHKVEPTYNKGMGVSAGKSHAGVLTRGAARDKNISKLAGYNKQKTSAAKKSHQEVLKQLRAQPKANIKGLSETGLKYLKLKEQQKGDNMTELETAQARIKELETDNIRLSDEYADAEKQLALMPSGDKVAELEAKIAALQAELAKAKGETEVMAAEKKKADEAKMLAEKENSFNVLLSEGKACAAQKDAFVKGDMNEFVKLAQPVNLKASGSSASTSITDADASTIIKLAEEKQKSNPKLSRGEAISIAKKELKK